MIVKLQSGFAVSRCIQQFHNPLKGTVCLPVNRMRNRDSVARDFIGSRPDLVEAGRVDAGESAGVIQDSK